MPTNYNTKLKLRDTSFVDLMKRRIFNVLIIANPYDAFMLEDDGRVDEKIFDDITKESVACDERGRCFYIVDDFGVLYRYEDGELKEIDKKAKAGGNDGMKVNVLDGLLYYRKGADLYVTGDETKPTVVAEHCDSITSGMGTEYNIFYYDMSGKTHILIYGYDAVSY